MPQISEENEKYKCWVHPKNGKRYIAYIHLDMLDDWAVTCAWGGKDRPPSRIKHLYARSFEEAVRFLEMIEAKRLLRGYIEIQGN